MAGPACTKGRDSQGGNPAKERSLSLLGRGGATHGHAPTPVFGPGGGSISVVRAYVLISFGSAAGLLEVSEGRPGHRLDKVRVPGVEVPDLRGPVPCGRRVRPGP